MQTTKIKNFASETLNAYVDRDNLLGKSLNLLLDIRYGEY